MLDAQDIVQRIAQCARERRLKVTTAESCTGGLIAKSLTDLPGSSEWFGYGFVTYSNAAKSDLLGVDPQAIEAHGAVSDSTVRAMAEGALVCAGANYAIAVSGVAGPGGGSEHNPVGSVWIACAGGGPTVTRHLQLEGDRARVRERTALEALQMLWERMDSE